MKVNEYAKAIVGALTAGIGAWAVAMSDSVITPVEWSGVVVVVIGALGIIWGVPNAAPAEYESRHNGE